MKGEIMIYHLYTDGATSNNGKEGSFGGYAWALIANNKLIKESSHSESPTTNNICELKAVINGCEEALEWLEPFDVVLVYSDSAYIINCYKQNWYKAWEQNGWLNSKKEPVANKRIFLYFFSVFLDIYSLASFFIVFSLSIKYSIMIVKSCS